MPFSHHSHSGQFCKHAKGTLEQVVLEAIQRKFKVFALTEHVPRYRLEDLYPEEVILNSSHVLKAFLTPSPTSMVSLWINCTLNLTHFSSKLIV